jgi:hypothetical protein
MSSPGFVARNRVAITFLGAAIVLATFIVKDIWADSLKNTIESQENTAKSAVQRRETLDGEDAALGFKPPVDSAAGTWMDKKLLLIDHAGSNLMDLMKQLPSDRDELAIFSTLNNELHVLEMRWDGSPRSAESVAAIAKGAGVLYERTSAALLVVTVRAERVGDEEQQRLRLITYGVYLLVAMGIIIAAIGQAYDRT